MAAFVSVVRAYAVWIYLFLVFGIFIGVKMLVDAQRLSRTTLFSLDQERATEQIYRGLLLIGVLIVGMFFVTVIVVFVAPLAPQQESPILRGATATLPPIVFSTSTRAPTLTATPAPPTETPFLTATPSLVVTPTRVSIKPTPVPSTPTPVYALPAPVIVGPVPNGGTWTGEGQANAAMTFRWTCDLCVLGPNDTYEVVISFIDRSGVPRTYAGRTQDKFLSLKRIYEGGGIEIYQKAKEDTYQWYVQVKRDPGNQPISPPSETWKFIWH